MIRIQPWHVDASLCRTSPEDSEAYTLVPGGKVDYEKVNALYQKAPVLGYSIGLVEIINNPVLSRKFEETFTKLDTRGSSGTFTPKWKSESDLPIRIYIDKSLQTIAMRSCSPLGHAQCLPMFHGTRVSLLDSICTTGFSNLATRENGLFGIGVNNTSFAEYAYRVYSDGALLFNWIVFCSAYPVTCSDIPKLMGRSTSYLNYDAHYTHLVPQDPKKIHEIVYCPITKLDSYFYDELVVFEPFQVLPRYLITLTPDMLKLKHVSPSASTCTLLRIITKYFRDIPLYLQPFLEEQITLLKGELNAPLSTTQLSLCHLLESYSTEGEESIKIVLGDRMTKLLDCGGIFVKKRS